MCDYMFERMDIKFNEMQGGPMANCAKKENTFGICVPKPREMIG